MAELHVGVYELVNIRKHPNADSLELANIGYKDGYQVVLKSGQFKKDSQGHNPLVVYIPEGAQVPKWILHELGLEGALSQKSKDVVKAVRLRGEISQGLVWHPHTWDQINLGGHHKLGSNLAAELGITKWIAPVPIEMGGKQAPAPDLMGWIEIENLKKYPKTFTEGELVTITEKVHGTCAIFQLDVATGELTVASKGVAKDGLSLLRSPKHHSTTHSATDLKHIKRASLYGKLFLRKLAQKHLAKVTPLKSWTTEGNLYWRVADAYHLSTVLMNLSDEFPNAKFIALYGEVYGAGVQDLHYGADGRSEKPGFAAFDLRVGYDTGDKWMSVHDFAHLSYYEVPLVSVLYQGPYARHIVEELAVGPETISGEQTHIREGVVVRPLVERDSAVLKGRAIGKFVSEDYLLRGKNDKGEEPSELQ